MLAPNNLKTTLNFNGKSSFYEKDNLTFYYSELINVEEIIIEDEFVNLAFSTTEENPNFIKKSLDVYYRLTFKERDGELKVYDISHKPKHLEHKYFYIVKDNKIERIFYHKETMIDILDQYYESDKNFDDKNILDGKFSNSLCRNIKTHYTISSILICVFFLISVFSIVLTSFDTFYTCTLVLLLLSFIYSGILDLVSNKKDKLIELNKKKEIEKLINSL